MSTQSQLGYFLQVFQPVHSVDSVLVFVPVALADSAETFDLVLFVGSELFLDLHTLDTAESSPLVSLVDLVPCNIEQETYYPATASPRKGSEAENHSLLRKQRVRTVQDDRTCCSSQCKVL